MSSGYREDNWVTPGSGLGGSEDKAAQTRFYRENLLSPEELAGMYYNNDLAYRIVSGIVGESLKKEPILKNPGVSEDTVKRVKDRLDSLNWLELLFRAASFGRLFGDAFLFLGVPGEQSEPYSRDAGAPVSFLRVIDKRFMVPGERYLDTMEPNFMEPREYMIGYTRGGAYAPVIHETRLRRFVGVSVDDWERALNLGWNYSVLQRVYGALRDMGLTWNGVSALLAEVSIGVMKIGGLQDMIANRPKVAKERMELLKMRMGPNRLLVVDKDLEDYTRTETGALTGVSDLVESLMYRVGAAAEMPVTVLFGRSPAGMNATGDSDLENWYSAVGQYQTKVIAPAADWVLQSLVSGMGPDIPREGWVWEWEPLWTEKKATQIDNRQKTATTDSAYVSAGVYTGEQIAVLRSTKGMDADYSEIDVSAQSAILALASEGADGNDPTEPPIDPNKAPPSQEDPNPQAPPVQGSKKAPGYSLPVANPGA